MIVMSCQLTDYLKVLVLLLLWVLAGCRCPRPPCLALPCTSSDEGAHTPEAEDVVMYVCTLTGSTTKSTSARAGLGL